MQEEDGWGRVAAAVRVWAMGGVLYLVALAAVPIYLGPRKYDGTSTRGLGNLDNPRVWIVRKGLGMVFVLVSCERTHRRLSLRCQMRTVANLFVTLAVYSRNNWAKRKTQVVVASGSKLMGYKAAPPLSVLCCDQCGVGVTSNNSSSNGTENRQAGAAPGDRRVGAARSG